MRWLDSGNYQRPDSCLYSKNSPAQVQLFAAGRNGVRDSANFSSDPKDYSTNFFDGVESGAGQLSAGYQVTWNITDLTRVKSKVLSQRFISAAYKDDYNQAEIKYTDQLKFANQQISNALTKYNEVPIQLKSAEDAYNQKKALYENGLTNIVDVTQTLYFLN